MVVRAIELTYPNLKREREKLTVIISDPDLSVDNGSDANIGDRVVCPRDEYQPEVFKSLHSIIL